MQAAPGVRRHVQQQQGVAPHALVVNLQELVHAFHLVVLGFSPEPAGADGDICFGRYPLAAHTVSLVEGLFGGTSLSGGEAFRIQGGPVGAAGAALFIAHPAAAGAYIAEDDGVGLVLVYGAVEKRPVVILFLSVGTFSVGTIEPLLENRAVGASQNAFQGLDKDIVIGGGTVSRVMPVPGGDIHSELDSFPGAGLGEFFQDISLSVPPGTFPYGVFGNRAGPQAEAVVVLGGDDDALETGCLGRSHPLVAVQVCGVEEVFGFGAFSPFQAGEGVGAEVTEHIQFHILPGNLFGRGQGAVRLFCAGGKDQAKGQCGNPFIHSEGLFRVCRGLG